ncbi:MAG: LamG domain-containing protein [Candidatus Poribacteria bacterium]|nr:LamG domain-containing protein [Candidatus Poribacteria bacterium]
MINRTPRQIFVIAVIATLLMAGNVVQAQQAAIIDGLVSYWSFDRASVTDKTVKDIFGDNDGTMDGNVEVVDGKVGEALKFTGGHVDCGAAKDLTNIGNQITLEMWIKPEKAGWAIIAGVSKSGSNTYVIAWSDKSQVDFNIWNGALETWPFQSVAQPELDKWHHIAGVYDGAEAIIYINGELDSKKEFNGVLEYNGENFWMGARKVGGLPFNGLLDELRIYNRGLSQAEIKNNRDAVGLAVEPAQKLALTWGTIKVFK